MLPLWFGPWCPAGSPRRNDVDHRCCGNRCFRLAITPWFWCVEAGGPGFLPTQIPQKPLQLLVSGHCKRSGSMKNATSETL